MFKCELHHTPAAARSLCCAVEPHLMSYSGFLLWCCCINMFPCLSDESRDCSGKRGGVFYTSEQGEKKPDRCDMTSTKYGPRPLHNAEISASSDGDQPQPHPTRPRGRNPPQPGGEFRREMHDTLQQLSFPRTGAACPHHLLTKSALLFS